MKVELGSGYHPDMKFDIHIDLNPNAPHLEYNCDVDKLNMFGDNTIDEIRACDILEHFSYRDTIRVLKEWFRVLKPGGKLFIQTPNAKLLAQRWLLDDLPISDGMPIDYSASYWILGGHADNNFSRTGDNWRLNAHYALFSEQSIAFYLKKSGYSSYEIKSDGGSNMLVTAYK